MLKIYHRPGTRSVRPIWLCYELNLPLEVERVEASAEFKASRQWRAISPLGKVPALVDGDVTMIESGAMVEYILARYGVGRLKPAPDSKDIAAYFQWCWFSEATLLRPTGLNRLLRQDAESIEALARSAADQTKEALSIVDQALDNRDYLLGVDFSAADIMMGYSLALLDRLALLDDSHRNAKSYLARLLARPAFERALTND